MSAEENRALVLRFFEEAWVNLNVAALDELVSPDYAEHADVPGGRPSGRDDLKRLIGMYRVESQNRLRLSEEANF